MTTILVYESSLVRYTLRARRRRRHGRPRGHKLEWVLIERGVVKAGAAEVFDDAPAAGTKLVAKTRRPARR